MLYRQLQQRQQENRPIRIGVSGAGWMGSGFVAAVAQMPGMVVNVLADPDLGAAHAAFAAAGVPAEAVVEASAIGPAMDALAAGKCVVTGSYSLASQLDAVDIVADVTWSPAVGAETAYACIQNGKDVVLVNIEADVTVGHILHKLAQDAGVLYTVSSGDEPGCLMELLDFVRCLGYEVIAIGKGKNNPLDPSATPDSVAEAAAKAGKDAYQTASYVDGTKTMFEMTCAANASGCQPLQRSMTGPVATSETVTELFALVEDGGISRYPGVVDFVQGPAMAGCVFVVVRVNEARIAADLKYLKVGNGRYSTLFRPYHLWFLEAPLSVARAHLYKQATLVPLDRPVADVMTISKRDLRLGDHLDAFGGFTFHGAMDRAEEAARLHALPAGLAPDAVVTRPVAKGEVVTWEDVQLDEARLLVQLRRRQDVLFGHPL